MSKQNFVAPKLHIDLQWLNVISYSLERFTRVKDNVFNCRCPVCGDSPTDKKKKRFFFYVRKGSLNTMCHKCGYSRSFYNFMKDQYPLEFDTYKKETLFDAVSRDKPASKVVAPKQQNNAAQRDTGALKHITLEQLKSTAICVAELPKDHTARKYLEDRKFGLAELQRLYFTEDFKQTAMLLNKQSSEKLQEKESRIIIPFTRQDNTIEIIQGRSLQQNSALRYITIKTHDDAVKLFGLSSINKNKVVSCVEGPLDSLFVDNCIATCDANLNRSDADRLIWDIQPRAKEILGYMEEAIESGRSLVIWPMVPHKKLDINDLVKMGVTKEALMNMINKHTYSGLTAKLKFVQWKKL